MNLLSGIGRGPPSVHHPSVTRGQSEDQEKQRGGKTDTAGAKLPGVRGNRPRMPRGSPPLARGDRFDLYCGATPLGVAGDGRDSGQGGGPRGQHGPLRTQRT